MGTLANTIGIASVAATLGTAACTLASPTYISSQDAPVSEDAGDAPQSAATPAGAPSGDGGVLTCSASDFVKPDLTKLTACGDGKGHCYDKTKVALADQLVACPDAAKVCVPDEILLADGKPLKSCTSIIGPGGCVTATLFPAIISQGGGALKPDVCASTQLCVPCTNPQANNAPTPFCQPIGVHDTACGGSASPSATDAAAPPASTPCCTTKGKSAGVCIAETAVPSSQRDQTKQDVCSSGNKCVPAAFVSNTPERCQALIGSGVCMDKCFSDMMAVAGGIGVLAQAGCASATELCVPCAAVSGMGVPGCQ